MPAALVQFITIEPQAAACKKVLEALGEKPTLLSAVDENRLRSLYQMVDEDARVDWEAVSLGRLAHLVSLRLKIPSRNIAPSSFVSLAIGLAAEEEPEDSPLYLSRKFRGMHERLARTLSELRRWDYPLPDLLNLPDSVPERLRHKAAAIARIGARANQLLETFGMAHGTDVQQDLLRAEPAPAKMERVVVFFGTDRHPIAAQCLRQIASMGVEVIAIVEAAHGRSEVFAAARLIAEDLGVEWKEPEPTLWASRLFTEEAPSKLRAPQVEIIAAADALTECEWACRLAFQAWSSGTPLEHMAFVVRNLEEYGRLLYFAAKRHNLPVQMTLREPLAANRFLVMIADLLGALASQDVRRLQPFLRSSYWQIPPVEQRIQEEALYQAYQHRAEQWSWLLARLQELGVQGPLPSVLAWRQEALQESTDLVSWVGRLQKLLELPPLSQTVSSPQNPTYERDIRAKNVLELTLARRATMDEKARTEPWSLRHLEAEIRAVLDLGETLVPYVDRDGVRIVQGPTSVGECDVAFVLGASEGVWPHRRTEDPILDDRDRAELSALFSQYPHLPNSFDRAREERDHFIRLCALPSERLVISYPLTAEDRNLRPSAYLQELRQSADDILDREYMRDNVIPQQPVSTADDAVRRALDGLTESWRVPELHFESSRSLIRKCPDEPIPVRQIAVAAECAFRAAFGHQLKVEVKDPDVPPSVLISLPTKSRFLLEGDLASAQEKLQDSLQKLLAEEFPRVAWWEWRAMEVTGRRFLDGWAKREFEARSIGGIDLNSIKVAVPLGEEGTKSTFRVGQERVTIVDTLPAIATGTGGHSSIIYTFKHSSVRTVSDQIASIRDRVQIGLRMLAAKRDKATHIMIVDSASDRSLLFMGPSLVGDPLLRAKTTFTRRRIAEDATDLWTGIKDHVEVAVARIREGSIDATPGDYCEPCMLKDLCRQSRGGRD